MSIRSLSHESCRKYHACCRTYPLSFTYVVTCALSLFLVLSLFAFFEERARSAGLGWGDMIFNMGLYISVAKTAIASWAVEMR